MKNINDLQTQKYHLKLNIALRESSEVPTTSFSLLIGPKTYPTPDPRQAEKMSIFFSVFACQEKVTITNNNNDDNDNPFCKR